MRSNIKFAVFMLVALSLVLFTSCVKKKVDEPSPLGPAGYGISLKVSASSNVIFAGRTARDSTTVTARLMKYDGTLLSGKTVYFEVKDANGSRTYDKYGYFEGHQAVASKVTDGNGTATVTYYGPKATEVNSNRYLYITANIVWEGTENIAEWAPVYVVRDFTDLIFNVKVDPNILWCSNTRPESTITVFYAVPDGTPIVGRKIFFEIVSGLGQFKDGKTKTFKETDSNGNAIMIYRGPTSGELMGDDWVKIDVQPETWWDEWDDYLHAEFEIRLKKGN
jgi:hypothetical protein